MLGALALGDLLVMTDKRLPENLSPEQVSALERRSKSGEPDNGGNLLAAIRDNASPEISAREAEISKLVDRIRQLIAEVSELKTHALVSPKEAK